MFRYPQLFAAGLMTVTAASAAQANDYWYGDIQREQIHQQYLNPVEHNALHRGMNYGAVPAQPNYQYSPAFGRQPMRAPRSYGATYGNEWDGGGFNRAIPGFQEYPAFGTGCSRQRASEYGQQGSFPRFNGRGW